MPVVEVNKWRRGRQLNLSVSFPPSFRRRRQRLQRRSQLVVCSNAVPVNPQHCGRAEGRHCCRQVWLAGARGKFAPGAAGVQAPPHRQLNVLNPVQLRSGVAGCYVVAGWSATHHHHLVAQLRKGSRLRGTTDTERERMRTGATGGAAAGGGTSAALHHLAAGVHPIPAECACVKFDGQQKEPHVANSRISSPPPLLGFCVAHNINFAVHT